MLSKEATASFTLLQVMAIFLEVRPQTFQNNLVKRSRQAKEEYSNDFRPKKYVHNHIKPALLRVCRRLSSNDRTALVGGGA